jgi:hypothetical protein
VIYVARIERTGLFKIGYSRAPRTRISALAVENKSPVTFLAVMPGVYGAELRLHADLAEHRATVADGAVGDEQYRATDGFAAWLASVPAKYRVNVRRDYPLSRGRAWGGGVALPSRAFPSQAVQP